MSLSYEDVVTEENSHKVYLCKLVEVDGVFKGYMSDYDTLCSFIYFTCPSYRDIDDLETQYLDYLETNEKGDWLP